MSKKYKVVTGKPLLEALQHFELLFRNGYDTILFAFALIDEDLLSLKTDVMPFEAASLAYSQGIVVDGGQQCFAAWLVQELVVVLHSEYGMLKERQTVAIPVQEPDAKPSAIQACLVMVEVRRRKTKLNAFLKFGNSFNRLVQVCIGHGVLWCRGLMAGLLKESRYLPAPLNKRRID